MQASSVTVLVVVLAFVPASVGQALSCPGPCPCETGYTCIDGSCCAPAAAVSSSSIVATTRSITIPGLITATTTMSSSTCADAITTCSRYTAQCNVPAYRTLMYQKCRRTCNLCNGGSGGVGSGVVATTTRRSSTGCVDRSTADGRSDCAELSYLCNNRLYYQLMTQQCPRTCGRC
uniref:ShKT domain-containing protein n=1 Tax=Panagrellus redivivus TaxID=6233 RepID=A0A7E4UQ62_PANRE